MIYRASIDTLPRQISCKLMLHLSYKEQSTLFLSARLEQSVEHKCNTFPNKSRLAILTRHLYQYHLGLELHFSISSCNE